MKTITDLLNQKPVDWNEAINLAKDYHSTEKDLFELFDRSNLEFGETSVFSLELRAIMQNRGMDPDKKTHPSDPRQMTLF